MAGWWFSPGISSEVPGENHQPAISFNGRGIRNTRRKPPSSHKFKWKRNQKYQEKTTSQSSVLMEEESEVPGENHHPAISFNGRGIRSTRRKPPASSKSITNFIT
jgi:hypothetical protein